MTSARLPAPGWRSSSSPPREIEVLALLAEGMTNREIAAEQFISVTTASVHVSRILSKLSVPTRAAGERWACPARPAGADTASHRDCAV